MPIFDKIKEKELNKDFLNLSDNSIYLPAKDTIQEIFNTFQDKDGNFIEQFQTTGFYQRLWELFIFKVFISEGFEVKWEHKMPDFQLVKNEVEIFVEATTSNTDNSGNTSSELIALIKSNKPEKERREAFEKLKDYYIEKIGSALYSKLSEKYYERDHVKNKPLLFALAPLHDEFAKQNSDSLIIKYLYGLEITPVIDELGVLTKVNYKPQLEFKKTTDKTFEPFFYSENSENISAVIFFNDITLDKFNRMGFQSIKYENMLMARYGNVYNPKGAVSKDFFYFLNDKNSPSEDWKQGVSIFHNPNASNPIDPNLFENFRQVWLKNDKLGGFMPDFFPFNSFTEAVV